MFDTKTNESNDEGVSPVIGVILMVAITVILAAVIGAFVLDMAGNLQQNASASVQFSEDTNGDTVTARAVSMQNADFVELRAKAEQDALDGVTGSYASSSIGGTPNTNATSPASTNNFSKIVVDLGSVGNSATFTYGEDGTAEAAPPSGTITVVGYLKGQGSVLQTYNYGG